MPAIILTPHLFPFFIDQPVPPPVDEMWGENKRWAFMPVYLQTVSVEDLS